MLKGMTRLMRSHGSRCHTSAVENIGTQIDGFRQRIVMIGKLSRHRGDLYIITSVFIEHFAGDFATTQISGNGNAGIFPEFRLEPVTSDHAQNKKET